MLSIEREVPNMRSPPRTSMLYPPPPHSCIMNHDPPNITILETSTELDMKWRYDLPFESE